MKQSLLKWLLYTAVFLSFPLGGAWSQCFNVPNGQWPATTYTPTCNGLANVIAADCYAREYSRVAVTTGTSYTFSSSVATDFLTISNAGGTTSFATGTGSVTWVSTITGNVRFNTHRNAACAGDGTIERERRVQCGTPPPAPANDNCASALTITPGVSCTPTAGTTLGATQQFSPTTCSGSLSTGANDVWYSFTANGTDAYTISANSTTGFDLVIGSYSGCTAGNLIACSDVYFAGTAETINTGVLTAGTYYYRVYGFNGSVGTFTTCVTIAPPAPANDQCSAVTPVTLANGVPQVFNGTTVGATTTNDGVYNGVPTVWHAITLNGSCNNLTVSYCGSSPVPGDAWINMATNCPATATTAIGTFENTSCGDGNLTITYLGLAAGTYYIPVLGEDPGFNVAGPYTLTALNNICPPPPSNDDVCGALSVTVGTTTTPTYTSYTNVNATDGTFGFGPCGLGDYTDDVWFMAIVPQTGNIVVAIDPLSTLNDMIGQVYTSSNNTCSGTLTSIACNDDGGADLRPFVYAGGLTPGNTVFIRVSNYDAGVEGTFGIAVTDAIHWTGSTSTNPTVVTNWLGNPDAGLVSATTDVRIFNVPNALTTAANFNVLDAYINDGATIDQNGGNFRVNGDLHGGSMANPAIVTGAADNLTLVGATGVIDGYTNAQRVRINGNYTISAGSNHLNISSFIQAFTGVLTTNGNLTLLSGPAGTAYLQDFGAATGSVSGTINVQRYNPLGVAGFRQLGTPVQMPNISALSGFTPSGTPGFVIPVPTCSPLYVAANSPYGNWMQLVENGPVQFSCSQSLFQVITSGGMTNGRGYYLDVPGTSTLTFTGPPNTGIVNFGLTHANTAVTNGWNMVSNPYPSPLAWELLNVPVGVDAIGKIWVTSGTYTGTWQDLDPSAAGTQAVAIGQAFQVRVTIPGTSVPFLVDNTDRTTSAPTYLFEGNDPMTLNIDIIGSGFQDLTKVRFIDGATNNLDAMFDSPKMLGNANQPMVYSVWNGNNYSTNSYGELNDVYTLPLGVKVATSGQHTFTFSNIDQFPPSAFIYLEDTQLGGAWQDLRLNDTYSFTETAGVNESRFILHFFPPVEQTITDATCQTTGSVVLTEEAPATWNYVIADAQAQVVNQGSLNGAQTITNLPAGTYTLTLTEQTSGYVAVEELVITGVSQVSAQPQASSFSVIAGDEIQFTANTQNATAWAWSFGDGNTSVDQNPLHIYNASGNYDVTLTASNGDCDKVSVISVAVSVNTAGIVDEMAEVGVKMWNDDNIVYIAFKEQWVGETIFALYDVTGKMVFNTQLNNATGLNNVDCGQLAAGTYTVELRNGDKSASRKTVMGIK